MVYMSKLTGPTAEFEFKRGSSSSVKVGFKKPVSKEWNVVISPMHEKVFNFHSFGLQHTGLLDARVGLSKL